MKRKRKELMPDQILKRKQTQFRRRIRSAFSGARFEYIPSADKETKIGNRKIEVDAIFVYENIMVLCEDTCAENAQAKRDHKLKKNETSQVIKEHFADFYNWLIVSFPEKKILIENHSVNRFKVYFLYFSASDLDVSEDDITRYAYLKFVSPQTLSYFEWITRCIHKSARFEIFRFLGLKNEDIGIVASDSGMKKIKAPIIYPKEITGLRNNVRVVSFMMSAELLINTCYVLRKDNWEDSMYLYQRLVDKNKIKSIRQYLLSKGEAFYNNIIVALPDNVEFIDLANARKSINEISNLENVSLEISSEMNSICVIDGQHRIFAHYEGDASDANETKISQLRKQLHLLVTGLIFPKDMSLIERAQIQSEIFLDINSNAKPVPPNVLLQIEMIKDPFSDIGLSRRILETLNKGGIFKNMFEMSSLDDSKIKIASIIKFALRYLVSIAPSDGNMSFYSLWDGDKDGIQKKKDEAYNAYVKFCASALREYFGAIRHKFETEWGNHDSKLLSVTSINGFIIALTRQLSANGIKDFNFYTEKLSGWEYDFSKENFPFASSQYRKFSSVILYDVFGIHD